MDAYLNILRSLIERLEQQVGQWAKPGGNSAWVGDEKAFAVLMDRSMRGDGHLAQALRIAKAAIASGDREEIARAALYCQTYERTGFGMRAEFDTRKSKGAGGATRGKRQTEAAEAVWKPYVQRVHELVEKGVDEKKARGIVMRAMKSDGFVLPNTGKFPSDKAIRRHLAIKK